ncbi:hypothetical protein [uncultured Arcticibacterium sp.]|uniref:hypothetical protein n=1 Tax=uncultured Arcticibacterium sp. TaxID=2173042 RepID=UPI0030F84DBE
MLNVFTQKLKQFIYLSLIPLLLIACATSMTPREVYSTLPELTKTKFIPSTVKPNGSESLNCEILNSKRIYNAPVGLSVKNDLQNGAKGIDEWVLLDGGNSYRLVNYQWITVDALGTTQLKIEFDTMKCEGIN